MNVIGRAKPRDKSDRWPWGLAIGLLIFAGCPTWHAPGVGVIPPPKREESGESTSSPETSDVMPAVDSDGTLDGLRQRIDSVLEVNRTDRQLIFSEQGGWQIMHGVLAYGHELRLSVNGTDTVVVDHLIGGGTLAGFELQPGDRIGDRRGVVSPMQITTKIGQGHRDQWLAIIAQTGLPASTELEVVGIEPNPTIDDWVRQAEYDVPLNLELEFSWTLIGLLAYRDTDHRWPARDGNDYSIETLLASELRRDLELSVCGGTHRLNAIAMALAQRRLEGRPITGVWKDAESAIESARQLARQNQNSDGSYSLAYLHRPGWARDLSEQLGTTGHVLEFLALSSTPDQLRQPWVQRTAVRICQLLELCHDIDLECGVLYHALHGLQEYRSKL